jgi:exopolyphosphatase/pppGpp-phosphohydrolase
MKCVTVPAVVAHNSGSRSLGPIPRFGSSPHERRVAAIAVRLFDELQPCAQMPARFRRILWIAALVHDAGRAFGAKGHEVRGAHMVLEDATLRLTSRQRRRIAYLVRHHRGKVPRAGGDHILQPGDRRRTMRKLLGLLRAADALDSRHASKEPLFIQLRSRELWIIRSSAACTKTEARLRRKQRKLGLLRRTMKLRIRLESYSNPRMAAA